MNIERLEYLATWLENGAKHDRITFDMEHGVTITEAVDFDPKRPTDCKAICCIAGAATQFFQTEEELAAMFLVGGAQFDPEDNGVSWTLVLERARDLLGLTFREACDLFVPGNEPEHPQAPRAFGNTTIPPGLRAPFAT